MHGHELIYCFLVTKPMESQQGSSSKILVAFLALGSVFLSATGWLYWLSINRPAMTGKDESENNRSIELSFPTNLDELSVMASYLQQYKKDHMSYVLVLFCSAYLYKQTFAIPGSVFMNLLGGALFGVWKAFPLCCFLTAVGATCCYLLSYAFGRTLVLKYFNNRVAPLQNKIQENLQSLFFFLLFLRFFPMSPNWFLNITSPILGVPIVQFFFSVLIGLMPYNFMCIQTGSVLSEITSLNDMLTFDVLLKMVGVAFAALLPGILFRKYGKDKVKKEP
ncbi:transmembrane protein 41A-like [Amphiura filiformis]|uniref:transmembrane protein 41A-like n=1 Tax=Amphiura filiformis TaxID=82378 RepID=UPI003B20F6D6